LRTDKDVVRRFTAAKFGLTANLNRAIIEMLMAQCCFGLVILGCRLSVGAGIAVVQSAQDGCGDDAVSSGCGIRIFSDNPMQLISIQNEHVIQAFAFQALHGPLTDCIEHGSLKGGL
jgi:hypothetical protein